MMSVKPLPSPFSITIQGIVFLEIWIKMVNAYVIVSENEQCTFLFDFFFSSKKKAQAYLDENKDKLKVFREKFIIKRIPVI